MLLQKQTSKQKNRCSVHDKTNKTDKNLNALQTTARSRSNFLKPETVPTNSRNTGRSISREKIAEIATE